MNKHRTAPGNGKCPTPMATVWGQQPPPAPTAAQLLLRACLRHSFCHLDLPVLRSADMWVICLTFKCRSSPCKRSYIAERIQNGAKSVEMPSPWAVTGSVSLDSESGSHQSTYLNGCHENYKLCACGRSSNCQYSLGGRNHYYHLSCQHLSSCALKAVSTWPQKNQLLGSVPLPRLKFIQWQKK